VLRIHRKDKPNSFFMTSPHSIRKDTSPDISKTDGTTGTGSTPYPSENPLSSPILVKLMFCISFPDSCPGGVYTLVEDTIAVLMC